MTRSATGAETRPRDEDYVELTRQVAGLARDGLPLPGGLRALAAELPPGALRRMVESLAGRVEAGESLDDALAAEGPRFPAPLRGLIAAGARSGRLAEALGRFLDLHDLGKSLGRQLKVGLVYPGMLLATAFAVFVLVAFLTSAGFAEIFKDFGIDLPALTRVLIHASDVVRGAGWWLLSGPAVAVALIWVAMRLTLGPAERRGLAQAMPVVGPLWRDTAMAQFCPVLALLIESGVPLDEAIVLAGDAARDSGMAEDVRRGLSLADAVGRRPPFPADFGAFLAWGQANGLLVDSLRLSAETFETRARTRADFLARLCNAVSMVIVLWWVGLTILAVFLPILQLLGALAGNGSTATPAFAQALGLIVAPALAALGVSAVVLIVWWPLGRAGGVVVEAGGPAGAIRPAARSRFWYYTALGLSLIGSVAVAVPTGLLMNWWADDLLPAWWLVDAWPVVTWVATILAVLGTAMVIFSVLADRALRRAEGRDAEGRPTQSRRVRPRLPAWKFGLRHVMFAMAPLAILLVVARDLRWALPVLLCLLLPPVLGIGGFVALVSRRALRREDLLRVLAMASRVNRPLGPAVEAFAATCSGSYRLRAANLAASLTAGAPLPRALEFAPGVLSPAGEIAARVGSDTGTLATMLDEAAAASAEARAARVVATQGIGYPLAVLAVVAGAAALGASFVAPQFVKIFEDSGAALPEPARTVFAWCEALTPAAFLVSHAIEGVLLSGLIGLVVLLASLVPVAGLRWAAARMPLRDRWLRRRHAAIILRALAAGMGAGRALPEALDRLAASYPRPWIRRALGRVHARVVAGEDWADALRREGLIRRADAAVLRAAGRASNLGWAMREVAASGERRLAYRLQALGQLLQPLVIAALGLMVLAMALLYFQPLVTLIDSLARSSG